MTDLPRIPLILVRGNWRLLLDFVGKKAVNPVQWVNRHLPRSQAQLETELKGALKLVFWAALLAPVVIVPVYYLLVAFGLLPNIHLPG